MPPTSTRAGHWASSSLVVMRTNTDPFQISPRLAAQILAVSRKVTLRAAVPCESCCLFKAKPLQSVPPIPVQNDVLHGRNNGFCLAGLEILGGIASNLG